MKRNTNLIPRLLFSAALLVCCEGFALAQNAGKDEYPKVEVFAGFSAVGENKSEIKFDNGGRIGAGYAAPTGFEISVVRNWTRHIGLKGDFSAHFKNNNDRGPVSSCTPTCTIATQDFQIKRRVYNFLAGPEFKARNSSRFTPFAHVLGGRTYQRQLHNSRSNLQHFPCTKRHQLRNGAGGGLDIRATKRVSFRAQMDYNPIFIKDSTRNLARISLGVLFH